MSSPADNTPATDEKKEQTGRNPLHLNKLRDSVTSYASNNPYTQNQKPPRVNQRSITMLEQKAASQSKHVKAQSKSDESLRVKKAKAAEKRARSTMGQVSLDVGTRNENLRLKKHGSSNRSESLSDLHHRSKSRLANVLENAAKDSLESIKQLPEEEVDLHILDKYLLEDQPKQNNLKKNKKSLKRDSSEFYS